jgi:sortase A
MRRVARPLGTLLIVAGVGVLAWAFVVWQWQDPFTTIYTRWQQDRLESTYEQRLASLDLDLGPLFQTRVGAKAAPLSAEQQRRLAAIARKYRKTLREGDAIGRIEVPRLDVNMVLVEGTATGSLKKGPGRYRGSFLPGEGELVYIAGHRTTYAAPFSRIDRLRRGDRVFLQVPYGRFEYRISGSRIVRSDEVEVLKSKRREVVALQACHPRFFASHRYIAYAVPVRVELPNGVFRLGGERVAAAG